MKLKKKSWFFDVNKIIISNCTWGWGVQIINIRTMAGDIALDYADIRRRIKEPTSNFIQTYQLFCRSELTFKKIFFLLNYYGPGNGHELVTTKAHLKAE